MPLVCFCLISSRCCSISLYVQLITPLCIKLNISSNIAHKGKIEKTDWNVKEIEKKIEENKMGRSVRHDKMERVPKWSREQVGMRMMKQYSLINVFQMCICFIQFLARQIKMEKKGRDQKETDSKYADIDNTLKNIDRKIKEGNVLGYNKVSAMAEQFSNKSQDAEPKVHKSVNTTLRNFSTGGYSQQNIRSLFDVSLHFVPFVLILLLFFKRIKLSSVPMCLCKFTVSYRYIEYIFTQYICMSVTLNYVSLRSIFPLLNYLTNLTRLKCL